MYGCELMWGADKAAQVRQLVEESTGMACPCFRALKCPLLPDRAIQGLTAVTMEVPLSA